MSKKVNPAAVGIFVSGAITILVVSLIVLGSGKFFEKRERFVVYFQSSANGLQQGADVLLGGVKIGTVVNMRVQFDPETKQKVIPVIIELSANRIADLTGEARYTKDTILSEESVERAIKEDGLKARLKSKSALTGQLYVDFDFLPNEEGSYTYPGEALDGLTQIPSTKNEIEKVLESIAKGVEGLSGAKLKELIDNVNNLVTALDAKVADLDVKGISDKANGTLEKANTTLEHIDEVVKDEKIRTTLANIEAASADLKKLLAALDDEKINEVVAKAGDAIGKVEVAAGNISELTDRRATTVIKFDQALTSIEGAARSIRELADYLKRNPNALISGKKRP